VYPYNPPYAGAPYSSVAYRQKSAGLALLLAFLFPGAGHLYAGKIVKGITFIAAFFGLTIFSYVVMWYYFIPPNLVVDWPFNADMLAFLVIVSIVALIIWVYQLIDAYVVTKRYNADLMATGHEPW
jgi:TM2 domain-containing membrane protein YozV